MSMGSTKTWWLAALDPRVRLAIDLCCLTDFDSLIAAHGLSGHGIFYYVPSLLKELDSRDQRVDRPAGPHLSVNGRKDPLTPPWGRKNSRPSIRFTGNMAARSCHVQLLDCAHEETPEMRSLVIDWMEISGRKLIRLSSWICSEPFTLVRPIEAGSLNKTLPAAFIGQRERK